MQHDKALANVVLWHHLFIIRGQSACQSHQRSLGREKSTLSGIPATSGGLHPGPARISPTDLPARR